MNPIRKIYKDKLINKNNMLPGDRKGSPDDSFLFIDSGFLSKLSKYFGGGKYIQYDLIKFCEKLVKKNNLNCKEIFYYTAPPFQSDNPSKEEKERKDKYDKFIKKLRNKNIIVKEGRCQRLKINDYFIYKQKAVDSLMIIDLMSVPLKYPKIKNIIIIASDSDFVPVIDNLKKIEINIILATYFTKKRNTNFSRSSHLINSVNKYFRISKQDFEDCLLKK